MRPAASPPPLSTRVPLNAESGELRSAEQGYRVGPGRLAAFQRRLEGRAGRGAVDEGVILRRRRTGHELQDNEDRPLFAQQAGDFRLEIFEPVDRLGTAIAGGARDRSEIDPVAAGDRVAAIRLVHPVLAEEMEQV